MSEAVGEPVHAAHNTFAVKAVLLLASSMTVMAGATIAPALPELKAHFADAPNADYLVRLVLTIPALFIAILAPLSGVVLDFIGRKGPMVVALLVYAIAGTAGLYLDGITGILISRAVLGIGVAGIMTATTTLIVDYFTDAERHRFMGLQSAFMGYGGLVFLMIGGWLADLSWRGPFSVYALGLLMIPAVLLVIHEPRQHRAASNAGDGHNSVAGHQYMRIALIYFVVFFGFSVFYLVPTQLPFLLQRLGDHVSNFQVGLSIGLNSFVAATMASQYARLRRLLSPVAIISVMLVLWGAGYILVAFSPNYWAVTASLAVCGLGFGMLMPNLNVWMASIAPPRLRGRLMSGVTMSVFLGQFLSPIMSQPLVRATGIEATFGWVGGLCWVLAAVFGGWAIAGRKK